MLSYIRIFISLNQGSPRGHFQKPLDFEKFPPKMPLDPSEVANLGDPCYKYMSFRWNFCGSTNSLQEYKSTKILIIHVLHWTRDHRFILNSTDTILIKVQGYPIFTQNWIGPIGNLSLGNWKLRRFAQHTFLLSEFAKILTNPSFHWQN